MRECAACGRETKGEASRCAACLPGRTLTEVSPLRAGPSVVVEPGTLLEGKWRVEEPLGEGGMGSVVLATDLTLDRKVAVKLLADALCEDPAFLLQFDREARVTAQLDHPNVVPLYAVGNHQGRPFLVMKHLEGMSLAEYLRHAALPLPPGEVLSILRQLCRGLQFIHDKGVIHRDIKPSNIFIGVDGHVTLLDFGIFSGTALDPLLAGRMGTPSYMAPEQQRGEPVDARADLFALTLVWHELQSGERPPPFTERSTELATALHARPAGPRAAPRGAMAAVLERGLAPDRDARFRSAMELLEAIEAAERTGVAPPAARRRGRRLLGVAAVAGLALAVGAAWQLSRAARSAGVVLESPAAAEAPGPPVAAPVPGSAEAMREPGATPVSRQAAPALTSRATQPAPARERAKPRTPSLRTSPPPPARDAGPGKVRVVTSVGGEPIWASVWLDGASKGPTPLTLEAAPGRHRVRVERLGYQTVEREVITAPGETVVVQVELRP